MFGVCQTSNYQYDLLKIIGQVLEILSASPKSRPQILPYSDREPRVRSQGLICLISQTQIMKPAPAIEINPATGLHLPEIVTLKQKLDKFHDLPGLWAPEGGRRQDLARYRKMLRQPSTKMFVAESNSHGIVGYLTGTIQTRRRQDKEYRRVGMIREVFVKGSHRRRGVGTALVEAVVRFFERRRVKHLSLRNAIANRLANDFWEGLSFKPVLYTGSTTVSRLTGALRGKELRRRKRHR